MYRDSKRLGRCRRSVGREDEQLGYKFDSGEINILGVELVFGYAFIAAEIHFPTILAYTSTAAEFQNRFASSF